MCTLGLDSMHHDQEIPAPPSRSGIQWPVIWAIIAFFAGALFNAGLSWGHGSTSLDNLTLTVAQLKSSVDTLTDKYVTSDKSVAQQLQKIEDHLSYDDQRLDRLEGIKH